MPEASLGGRAKKLSYASLKLAFPNFSGLFSPPCYLAMRLHEGYPSY